MPRRTSGIEELDRDLAEVVQLYEDGAHSTDIAARYGVTYDSVLKRLRAQGVKIRPRGGGKKCPRLLSPEQEQDLIRRYRSGDSMTDIASDLSVSYKTGITTLVRYGIPRHSPGSRRSEIPERDRVPLTKRRINGEGYALVWLPPDDPYASMCQKRGWVPEHRLKVARKLGRPLLPTESVHHKNGIRDDNRLRNLEIWRGKHSNGQRWRCAECGSENLVAV